jgi:hypothetical protein
VLEINTQNLLTDLVPLGFTPNSLKGAKNHYNLEPPFRGEGGKPHTYREEAQVLRFKEGNSD